MAFLDQCALRPDGSLKDASEIVWVNDPDDETPAVSAVPSSTSPYSILCALKLSIFL